MKNFLNKITIILIVLGTYAFAYGQSPNVDLTERGLIFKNTSPTVNAEGSPYINENFIPLKIKQYSGKVYSGRFNAYNGEMEVKLEDNKVIALDNKSDFEITFTSKNKVYKTYTYTDENSNNKRGFLVVLKEANGMALLKKERIKFNEQVKAQSSYDKDKPASFDRVDDTYFVKANGKAKVLSQKKKDFLKSFPGQEDDLKSYMKKNKLNPKNEDDLLKLFEYVSNIKN